MCDDFFDVVITGHVLSAALHTLGMSKLDEQPSDEIIESAETLWTRTTEERKEVLMRVSKMVVENFVNISFNNLEGKAKSCDDVHNYNTYLLSIGCFLLEYKDAIKEGDGNRLLRCWRYLLPIFHNTGQKNYCIEAFNLLCQYHYDLPAQQAGQLIWSRSINTHGVKGRNIPFDLHLEHLNRLCKESIKGLGANKTKQSIVRVAKILGTMDTLLSNFDSENGVTTPSGAHRHPSFEKDLGVIINELQQSDVFSVIPGRKHPSFPKLFHVFQSKPTQDIKMWVIEHLQQRY